jgi:alkyldihydroxyacetonephosphate synthase
MKESFGLSDADFAQPGRLGLEELPESAPEGRGRRLSPAELESIAAIVGAENLLTSTWERVRASYGKTLLDLERLRSGILENLPDAVARPRSRGELRALMDLAGSSGFPLYLRGGGSSVTKGCEAVRGGLSLDLGAHLDRVLGFDETNQTITVEAGMSGPELERALAEAPARFGASRAYTLGHFPQSFEYSSVGGWIVTRGAGQNSTYYGKIEDLVLSQDYVTPRGDLRTRDFPAASHGPDVDQIMMGSEGSYGILYAATLKLHRAMPANTRRYSYVFRDWEDAKRAAREVMQGEFGLPSAFRLSDPEESEVALRLYGVAGGPGDSLLGLLGYRPGRRCLLLGTADGETGFSRHVARMVGRIARRHGALPTTGLVTRAWEHGRFLDPYLREDLGDYGIMIDTLECSVNWGNLEEVHSGVRAFCHSRPRTICMTHMSHFYPQGCNLYFIVIGRMEGLAEYEAFQRGILDAIRATGATMSHHHGIGKLFAPWLEGEIGSESMALLRAIKGHFDPDGLLNPGGTLALDLEEGQRR